MRAIYEAKPLGGINSTPQLNFSWSQQRNELWFEMEIHIPENYFLRNNYDPGPPVVSMSDNNKFWLFYAHTYSDGYVQMACELRPLGYSGTDESDGKAYVRNVVRLPDSPYMETIPGYANPLIRPEGPCVPGSWNIIRGHIRKASAMGVPDGIWEMWVNGVLHTRIENQPFGSGDPEKFPYGIDQGYFLGAANSGYTEATTFHLQRIAFWDVNPGWTD